MVKFVKRVFFFQTQFLLHFHFHFISSHSFHRNNFAQSSITEHLLAFGSFLGEGEAKPSSAHASLRKGARWKLRNFSQEFPETLHTLNGIILMDVHGMFLERETTDVTDFHRMFDGKGLRNPEKFFGGKEQVVFNLLSHALRWDIVSIAFSCHGGETGLKDRGPNHKVKQRKSIHAIYLNPCSIIRMERKNWSKQNINRSHQRILEVRNNHPRLYVESVSQNSVP